MALFAKIENNLIVDVIVAEQEFIDSGAIDGLWIECTQQDGIGDTYNPDTGEIWPPKPYPSWLKDIPNKGWKAPIPIPDDAGFGEGYNIYSWDEDSQSWAVVNI